MWRIGLVCRSWWIDVGQDWRVGKVTRAKPWRLMEGYTYSRHQVSIFFDVQSDPFHIKMRGIRKLGDGWWKERMRFASIEVTRFAGKALWIRRSSFAQRTHKTQAYIHDMHMNYLSKMASKVSKPWTLLPAKATFGVADREVPIGNRCSAVTQFDFKEPLVEVVTSPLFCFQGSSKAVHSMFVCISEPFTFSNMEYP